MYYALLTLFIIVAVLLIVISLLQKGRGDVGAAFGGAMGQSIFGAGGVDTILTKLTYWLGGIFLLLAVLLSVIPRGEKGSILKREAINEVERPAGESAGEPRKGSTDNPRSPTEDKTGGGSPEGRK